jgi:hypothetical protein
MAEFCISDSGCRYMGDGDTLHSYGCMKAECDRDVLVAAERMLKALEDGDHSFDPGLAEVYQELRTAHDRRKKFY